MLRRTRVARRTTSRGFTLVELLITVGVIAILLSVTAYSLLRSQRRINVDRVSVRVRGLLEQARALAAIGGSRVGSNRIEYDASCTDESTASADDPTQWQLWVRFDGNVIEAPNRLEDTGDDTVRVVCETFNVEDASNEQVAIVAPVAGDIAFTPSGRTLLRGFPGTHAFIQFEDPNAAKRFGIRVMRSGVMCDASIAAGPPWCDEAP